ncbi:hypothetical protein B0J14DRAFT_239839 [Halenospora varia]|nr:hypothetical protein B0J14DRAFT_239839 [Halenospora varia]
MLPRVRIAISSIYRRCREILEHVTTPRLDTSVGYIATSKGFFYQTFFKWNLCQEAQTYTIIPHTNTTNNASLLPHHLHPPRHDHYRPIRLPNPNHIFILPHPPLHLLPPHHQLSLHLHTPGTFPNGLPSILTPHPSPNSTLISYMEIEPGDGDMTVKIVGSEKPDGDRVEVGYVFGRGVFWYDLRVVGKGLGRKVWLGTDVKNGSCLSATAAEVGTVSWLGKEGRGGGNCGRREGIAEEVNLVVDIC